MNGNKRLKAKNSLNPGRVGQSRSMAQLIPRLTKPILGKRGLAQADIVLNWPNIVGLEITKFCQPEKITFPKGLRHNGTLHLRASAGAALEMQHDSARLIERINGYFGYAAITKIRLIQIPLKLPTKDNKTVEPRHVPTEIEIKQLEKQLEIVEDNDLRMKLERLGMAILSESIKMK